MTALERAVKLKLMPPGEPSDTLTREEVAEIIMKLYNDMLKLAMASASRVDRMPWKMYR